MTGVAKYLETPQWNNTDWKLCDESKVYGCKVTHDITYPEYYVVIDDVGSNVNQKGNRDVGTEGYLCGTEKFHR